ncbi:hypothetical protein [Salinihabitans flavidus]|uniref:hypothetical protein n=1 Tax=Salinihabitans flavidus TaxID=569882 RepID=UPI00111382E7|nr:hypothetical protein [Salinihabitans flavidus]
MSQYPQLALNLALILGHEHLLLPKPGRLSEMSREHWHIYTGRSDIDREGANICAGDIEPPIHVREQRDDPTLATRLRATIVCKTAPDLWTHFQYLGARETGTGHRLGQRHRADVSRVSDSKRRNGLADTLHIGIACAGSQRKNAD